MPRKMPELAKQLQDYTGEAAELARSAERIRVQSSILPSLRTELSLKRLHLIYEMAFLRIFAQWETFLEESFLRFMCGYLTQSGQQITAIQPLCKDLSTAKSTLFAQRPYLLWHEPDKIIQRSRSFFQNSPHEIVILSNTTRIRWFAHIRHRIAHDQEDARTKFDSACMNLCGRRFRGGRPGMFLRDWTTISNRRLRWLEAIGEELTNLAVQITA